jgi:hypothetical protein
MRYPLDDSPAYTSIFTACNLIVATLRTEVHVIGREFFKLAGAAGLAGLLPSGMKKCMPAALISALLSFPLALADDLEYQGWKAFTPREEIRPVFSIETAGGPD